MAKSAYQAFVESVNPVVTEGKAKDEIDAASTDLKNALVSIKKAVSTGGTTAQQNQDLNKTLELVRKAISQLSEVYRAVL